MLNNSQPDFSPQQLDAAIRQAFGNCADDVLAAFQAGSEYLDQLSEVVRCMGDIAKSKDPAACLRIASLAETAALLAENGGGIIDSARRNYAARLRRQGVMSADTFA